MGDGAFAPQLVEAPFIAKVGCEFPFVKERATRAVFVNQLSVEPCRSAQIVYSNGLEPADKDGLDRSQEPVRMRRTSWDIDDRNFDAPLPQQIAGTDAAGWVRC